MTTFGDHVYSAAGLLTPNGIPATFGTTYFVDKENGSDGFNGLSMTDTGGSGPKKTVLAAYNATTDNKHDVIVMSGVGTHSFTAELVVAKNRVHFVGLGGGSRYMGQRTKWDLASGGSANSACVRVTGTGCTFTNIKISNSDSSTSFAVADGGEFTQWTNVEMINTQNLGTVTDAHLLCNADTGYYLRCSIGSSQEPHAYTDSRGNVLFTKEIVTGKVCRDTIFEDCIFPIEANSATGCSCLLITGAGDINRILWLKNCVFWGSKLSDTIDRAIQIDVSQTEGDIFLDGCTVHGIDDVTATGTTAVFHNAAALGNTVSMVATAAGVA